MLTAAWPPVARVGGRRPLRLARRLGGLGWTPVVLTPDPDSAFDPPAPIDFSLVAPPVEVHRVAALFPSNRLRAALRGPVGRLAPRLAGAALAAHRRLLLPDVFPEWTAAAVRAARALEPVDVVWVTGGPWGLFVCGAAVAAALDRPLVLDYRDPWSAEPIVGRAAALSARRLAPLLEGPILRRAAAVIYVNEDMLRQNEARFGRPPGQPWEVIPNGFDPEDLGTLPPTRFERPTLLYAGNCYANRRMQPVLEALARGFGPGQAGLALDVYGSVEPAAAAWLAAHPLPGRVHISGRVGADVLAAHLRGAAASLMLVGDTHHHALSGKIFDYLAVDRPILVVGPPDCAAGELVRRAGVGAAVDERDQAALVGALRAVEAGTLPYAPVAAAVRACSADGMAERTAAVLDAVVGAR